MDGFLSNLVGKWNLRGKMGDKTLLQKAVGSWVLHCIFAIDVYYRTHGSSEHYSTLLS